MRPAALPLAREAAQAPPNGINSTGERQVSAVGVRYSAITWEVGKQYGREEIDQPEGGGLGPMYTLAIADDTAPVPPE